MRMGDRERYVPLIDFYPATLATGHLSLSLSLPSICRYDAVWYRRRKVGVVNGQRPSLRCITNDAGRSPPVP